jgi:hypothetical protein
LFTPEIIAQGRLRGRAEIESSALAQILMAVAHPDNFREAFDRFLSSDCSRQTIRPPNPNRVAMPRI